MSNASPHPLLMGSRPRPHDRFRTTLTAIVLIATGVVTAGGAPAGAQDAQVLTGPVRFEVADGGRLEVDRGRRYLDTLEVRDSAGGIALVNELGIDDYVAGIAEMPAQWHLEALKAQAVAARTYGWYVLRTSSYDGYDICATVACQVFRGADVVLGTESGDRWREAVDATRGEVLLEGEAPILARYFSTSGGRTYANEEVFPSSGPRDYLISIPDPYDEVSPYHRWTVVFTRDQFDEVLSRGDRLAAAVPVADVERLGAIDDPSATIRVTGQSGTQVEVGAGELRDFLSRVAPDRFPESYPPPRNDGLGTLPSTIPTARYDLEVTDDEVIVQGQGWGHGVGMGQYGARGRADAGQSYTDILAAYYNGLVPQQSDALPERIRVGLTSQGPGSIGGDQPIRITSGGELVEQAALGTWGIERDGDGWRLTPPEGHATALEVTATTVAQGLRSVTDAVTAEVDVNKPVTLDLEVTTLDGDPVIERSLGVVEAGRHAAVWRLDTADGSSVGPGTFLVALVGEDHMGERSGTPVEVTLPLEGTSAPWGELSPESGVLRTGAILAAVLALAVALLLVVRRPR